MILLRKFCLLWGCCVLLVITGCQTAPKPEEFFYPVSLEDRQMQTRIYPSNDEIHILKACTDLLLDNDFQVREAESRLGWIDAAKFKAFQWILVDVVTRPVQGRSEAIAVRVTFQVIKFRQGIFRVKDPAIYQEFFAELSKTLFLEAQQI
jgi:hypothetical protein